MLIIIILCSRSGMVVVLPLSRLFSSLPRLLFLAFSRFVHADDDGDDNV